MSFDCKLKTISTEAIQDAIAKALGDLAVDEYQCSVSELKFEGPFKAVMRIEVSRKLDLSAWARNAG